MSSTNETVDLGNRTMLRQVPGTLVVSKSTDMCVEDEDEAKYDADV